MNIDVAIIGGGPAGLAAAIRLYNNNIRNIILFERNDGLGGILNQCIHSGFGIDYYNEELTGPVYAKKMTDDFMKCKIKYQTGAMVIDINPDKIITVSSYEKGIEKYRAKAVIVATGCRERTRENLEVAGTRPAGIFTAGQAQELVNIRNLKIGNNVIIQGSGDIGLIMARRLTIEGYNVIKVLERLPYLSALIRNKVQCLDDYNIPLEFKSQIISINGSDRVEEVTTAKLDDKLNIIKGSETRYKCDTVLFSVGLIPEVELLKNAGVNMENNFNPVVNSKFETDIDGIFTCGNSLHIHDLADNASLEAEKTADYVRQYLNNKKAFNKNRLNEKPYAEPEDETKYNDSFFNSLSESKICIICPKSCVVSINNYGCKRGKDFFIKESKCKKRQITTTIYCEYRGIKKRIPIITHEEIELSEIEELKKIMRKIKKIDNKEITIDLYGKKINLITL